LFERLKDGAQSSRSDKLGLSHELPNNVKRCGSTLGLIELGPTYSLENLFASVTPAICGDVTSLNISWVSQ
jgi:hypothetical protein